VIQSRVNTSRSLLVICPGCGDVWARLEGTQEPRFWDHRYVPCQGCPDASFPYGGRIPGSLCEALDPGDELSIPDNLIPREFELTMSNLKEFS
jgi:hypothetical protein